MSEQKPKSVKPAEPEFQVITETIPVPTAQGQVVWQKRERVVMRRR